MTLSSSVSYNLSSRPTDLVETVASNWIYIVKMIKEFLVGQIKSHTKVRVVIQMFELDKSVLYTL